MHHLAPLAAACLVLSAAPASAGGWVDHVPIPSPIANNAVTAHTHDSTPYIYSFMGIDDTKVSSGIQLSASRLNLDSGEWEALPDVPGSAGRIAALAFGFGDKVYLFGGYTVTAGGAEVSSPAVDIYDPAMNSWSSGAPTPVPVDDMVGGVWNDELIYLVSGWSNTGNVRNVQLYDPVADSWSQAPLTPFSGSFGGAGGIVGDTIVYADGVPNTFVLRNQVWTGEVNPADPTDISWTNRGAHAGPAGYRMASGSLPGDTDRIFFGGGTDNAYNFDGIGYDGQPSEPLADLWAYLVPSGIRVNEVDRPTPAMDHRGFAASGGALYVVGGMTAGQMVTGLVSSFRPGAVVTVPTDGSTVRPDNSPMLTAAPNPARASVRVRAVAEKGVLRDGGVYDTSGRRVRALTKVDVANGFTWDLTDDGGTPVAPGVYWIQGRVYERNVRHRIVVTR